jgi:hypothetical protein
MRNVNATLISLILFVLLFNYCCSGVTITVNQDPNAGADFTSIQKAIDAAWDFDTIVVNPGIYTEHINYHGAMVTVTSIDPNDPNIVESTIIDGNGTGNIVIFSNAEGPYSILEGLTVTNGQNGIECTGADTSPLISKCRVVTNNASGIVCSLASPTITYCTIEDNKTAGISGSFGLTSFCLISANGSGNDGDGGISNCSGLVHDCVISNNNGDGVYDGIDNLSVNLRNCIISANSRNGLYFDRANGGNITNCTIVGNNADGIHFYSREDNGMVFNIKNSIIVLNRNLGIYYSASHFVGWSIRIDYSNMWGNLDGDYGGPNNNYLQIEIGSNQLSEDPFFAKRGFWDSSMIWYEGDYHLKSTLGRWDTRSLDWAQDPIDSPCLDRGDPNDSYDNEPYPNSGRINLGAYGNTIEASMSEGGPIPYCVSYPEMDFNGDCMVDLLDYNIFMDHWLECNLDPNSACDCVTEETE